MLSKKEKKRLYDIEYRRKNSILIKKNKSIYYKTELGKAASKRNRNKRKNEHLEYCRTEKYKSYKRSYDHKHNYETSYGEFAECMMIVDEIKKEVRIKIPDKYERLKMRGTIDRNIAKRALKRHIEFGWAFNWSHVLNIKG